MISAISIKDRLKNQAEAKGKIFQEMLVAYGLERTVYRLSVSKYMERFTLKGGIFLYALFDGEFARATRDIDLLARNISNNAEDIKKVFENIFSIDNYVTTGAHGERRVMKVGRNDPCPCGSGKKYKHCHGR